MGIVKTIYQEPLSGDIVDDIIMFKVKVGRLETTWNKNKCRRERSRIIPIMSPEKIIILANNAWPSDCSGDEDFEPDISIEGMVRDLNLKKEVI